MGSTTRGGECGANSDNLWHHRSRTAEATNSRQLKDYGCALVVALCGTVFGLLGVVCVFIVFGHLSSAFFRPIHMSAEIFTILMVLIGFLLGWIIGYREAKGKFLN